MRARRDEDNCGEIHPRMPRMPRQIQPQAMRTTGFSQWGFKAEVGGAELKGSRPTEANNPAQRPPRRGSNGEDGGGGVQDGDGIGGERGFRLGDQQVSLPSKSRCQYSVKLLRPALNAQTYPTCYTTPLIALGPVA